MLGKNLIQAATGAAGDDVLGVEDVFSTWLYTGNGSTQTIPNGIDLDGEGGMVWLKQRNTAREHFLFDTQRGVNNYLYIATQAQITNPDHLTSFNSDGFLLGSSGNINQSTGTYASWTFRKAEKFFDMVTYTGNGSAQNISHNLGSVPGFIIIKRTDSTSQWICYHRGVSSPNTQYLVLNGTAGAGGNNTIWPWNNTAPTDAQFTVRLAGNISTDYEVNINGATYVAYIFAHDAGGFGDSGDESVIKCGSYTGTGAAGNEQTLGWEPQWLLIKRSNSTEDWQLVDSMRGMPLSGAQKLFPNLSNAEVGPSAFANATATGFIFNTGSSTCNASGGTYIYIAIRRGPMKRPTDATEVFNTLAFTGSTGTSRSVGFPIDLNLQKARTQTYNSFGVSDRLRGLTKSSGTGTSQLYTASSVAETVSNSASVYEAWNTTRKDGAYNNVAANIEYNFRRAPGFFDVVAYSGTGVSRDINHGLGVTPELIITKQRNGGNSWIVTSTNFSNPTGNYLNLNSSSAISNINNFFKSPTSTTYGYGTAAPNDGYINQSGSIYITYLFATCPGVSKVGSYTGTGTTRNIDCGFTAGARFLLIKRTDSTGDWYVFDTARGFGPGNDAFLRLNTTAAENTSNNFFNALPAGFQIIGDGGLFNLSGATYIFLAIA